MIHRYDNNYKGRRRRTIAMYVHTWLRSSHFPHSRVRDSQTYYEPAFFKVTCRATFFKDLGKIIQPYFAVESLHYALLRCVPGIAYVFFEKMPPGYLKVKIFVLFSHRCVVGCSSGRYGIWLYTYVSIAALAKISHNFRYRSYQ